MFSGRSLVVLAAVVIVGVMGYAGIRYSGGGGGGGGAAADESAPIKVKTGQLSIIVENQSGLSLFDVEVVIVPVGRATVFTRLIGRMDSGEKRDISLSDFRGRDGTPFTLRVHRPRAVQVKATDMNQKKYDVETDW